MTIFLGILILTAIGVTLKVVTSNKSEKSATVNTGTVGVGFVDDRPDDKNDTSTRIQP